MTRKRLVIAGAVAVLLSTALAIWWKLRHTGSQPGREPDLASRLRAARGSAPADLTPGTVTGIVKRKSDGAGIGGAAVTIVRREIELSSPDGMGAPTLVIAGPDGRFEGKDLIPGKYRVAAAAPGFIPASRDFELAPREREEGIELTLEAGGHDLSGLVTDVGGGPVAGARVSAQAEMALWDTAPVSVLSGEDGTYRLTLAAGDYDVEASHPEYVGKEESVEIVAPRRLDFTLVPGGAIHGRVVSRQGGTPVPGARVSAASGGGFAATGLGVEADAEGRFTVRGLAPGEVALRAVAKGYGTSEPTLVELGIGEELEGVVVLVDPAFTVSGFVVAKPELKQGIPGVIVGGFTLAGRQTAVARAPTEKDGYFEIHGVPPGSYMVFALGEGLLPSVMSQSFTVDDRDIDDLIIGLERGVTLSGRVDPPAKARISLGVDDEDIGLGNLGTLIAAQFVRATTDEKGEFVLRGVPAGKVNVVARAEDGRRGKLPVEVRDRPLEGLIVKLERRGAIAGRVVDESGRPVEGVRVKGSRPAAATRSATRSSIDEVMDRGVATAPDGSFRLAGLEPGALELSVHDARGQLAFVDAAHRDDAYKPVPVMVEGTAEVAGVVLTVEGRGGVIRGVVLGPNGAPAPDVWVTATRHPRPKPKPAEPVAGAMAEPTSEKRTVTVSVSLGSEGGESRVEKHEGDGALLFEDRAEPPVLTDEAGRFEVKNLRRASYDLVAADPKRALRGESKDVKSGESVTVRLEAMAELSGTVRLRGAPVSDYLLQIGGPREHSARVRKADGAYAVKRLPAGKYTVSARTENGFGRAQVELAAGERATADVSLAAWSKVTGTVVSGKTQQPMEGLRFFTLSGDEIDEEAILAMVQGKGKQTDAAGRFQLDRLKPGEGHVMFMQGDFTSMRMVAEKKFTVAEGQALDVGVVKALDVPAPPKGGEPGLLGLSADETEGVLRVTQVAPAGAAAQAGIAVGDVILAVDEHAVADYGANVVQQLLDAERIAQGQVVTLRLDKKGDVKLTARPAS